MDESNGAMADRRAREASAADKMLLMSAAKGDAAELRGALALGADPDARSSIASAAHLAIRARSLACVEVLAPRIDAAAVDKSGVTPFLAALGLGDAKMAEALLPFSDPAAIDPQGAGALARAALHGDPECMDLALRALGEERAKEQAARVDWSGGTPLMWLARAERSRFAGAGAALDKFRAQQSACLAMLLPVSDLAVRSGEGQAALEFAASCGAEMSVEAILAETSRREAELLREAARGAAGSGNQPAEAKPLRI